MKTSTGNVKWFDTEKGFGFIQMADGKDIFVDAKTLKRLGLSPLQEGQRVEFRISQDPNGRAAADNIAVIALPKKVTHKTPKKHPGFKRVFGFL